MKPRIYIVLPFVAAAAVLVALMPHGGRFKYDYIMGREWKYPTLTAEFDFPLYKTNAELSAERSALLNSFLPYYQNDTTLTTQQVALFNQTYKNEFKKNAPTTLTAALQFVYSKGIRTSSRIADSFLDSTSHINVVTAHYAAAVPAAETFSDNEARRYFLQQINTTQGLSDAERHFLRTMDYEKIIVPNLIFDNGLTAAAKQERLALLSPTCGVVVKGERIISKGEVVTGERLRKLNSYRREYELQFGFTGNMRLLVLGQSLLVLLLLCALLAYLYYFRRSRLSLKNSCFIALLIVFFFALTRWTAGSADISIYIIPYALLATYICTFIGHRVAIVVQVVAVLLASVAAPFPFGFILTNILAGFIAIFYAKKSYRRSSLHRCAVAVFVLHCILHIVQLLMNDGSIDEFSWSLIFQFGLNAGLVIAGYQLIFLFEKIFGYISNTTLMEITDTNQPLLRLLAEKAPATFQHSVQVANLAETAISKIGGNPLLVRAGALYHDIGKLQNPSYFIENQVLGYNPHTNLSPEESAQIIIRHVADGVSIARKYRLPQSIIDFIFTHHGTSRTRYFYRIYKEMHPAAADFSVFTYNGANPATREQAVLMLADVVEAGSRTIASYSAENIDQLVESAIGNVLYDKVLNNSPLTFSDITTIKSAFKKKLQNIYHARAIN